MVPVSGLLKTARSTPTGFWAEEFIAPYDIFTEAGYDITVATPRGVKPVVDEISLSISGGTDPLSAKKLKSRLAELSDVLENPADLHDQNEEDYDLVFYPGGHGPMEDELVARGLDYDKGLLPFTSHVVVDGNLYTGQNPQSSKKLAKTLVEALGEQG